MFCGVTSSLREYLTNNRGGSAFYLLSVCTLVDTDPAMTRQQQFEE